ncbi:MAG: META domain-containing protein [Thiobacillaceae bacterium]|jgi:heat shock protein HslJ|nr:META domain-containing protein [Thiobacillaceae bacterium]
MRPRLPCISLAFFLALSTLTLSAQAMGARPVAPALDGTQWQLRELGGQPVAAKPTPTLSFEAGRVGGSDGCNLIMSGYVEGRDGALGIQRMATTMRACEAATMRLAANYSAALGAVARYRVEAGSLRLEDKDGALLAVFKAQPVSLAGSTWRLTSFNNGRMAVTSVLADTEIHIVFGDDGRVSGHAGCNRFSGPYTADAATRRFRAGPLMTTRMACPQPEGRMAQETQFLAALARGETYRRSGDSLEIRSGDGALQASFTLLEQ